MPHVLTSAIFLLFYVLYRPAADDVYATGLADALILCTNSQFFAIRILLYRTHCYSYHNQSLLLSFLHLQLMFVYKDSDGVNSARSNGVEMAYQLIDGR